MTPIQNLEELIQILEKHPEWRERLLKVLLTDEFLRLPPRMDRLEAIVTQLAEQMKTLAENQQQLQLQLQALTEQVKELVAVQKRMQEELKEVKEDVAELKKDVKRLDEDVKELKEDVKGLKDDVGYLKGRDREQFYRENASAIFGKYLRKIRVIEKGKLLEQMDTVKALTDEEWKEIVDLDLAVEGVTRKTGRPVLLAMEVSWVIDSGDVERAAHRATLMRERGLPVIPVVGGKELLPDAKTSAQLHQVLVILDGRILDRGVLE